MRILFDIVHPAHVHFFKQIIWGLQANGHQTKIVARDKDVTLELLNQYGFVYSSIGQAGRKSRVKQFVELLRRDLFLLREARAFKADIIMTRNPAGIHAARLMGAVGIFDTDDGLAAGIQFRAAAPFADYITTPDCFQEDYGEKHLKYNGYKQSAYLHPDIYNPGEEVLELLGVNPGETYYLLRFVSMTASHDTGETGFPLVTKREIIRKLLHHGPVFISCEGDLPNEWTHLRVNIPAHLIHDAMAHCAIFIGDSQTMAAEAAFLGTPNLRISSFVGRLSYLEELEHTYGLTFGYLPEHADRLVNHLAVFLANPEISHQWSTARQKMLAEKQNVATWFIKLAEDLESHQNILHNR